MEQQIKVRALIVDNDAILLVAHRNSRTGAIWWSPPGGTMEGAESIFACAIREVREEMGLSITPADVAYVREYIDHSAGQHNLELYITVSAFSGTLGQLLGEQDENLIVDLRFCSQELIQSLSVFPTELQDLFWDDQHAGSARMRYLGCFSRA